jgi:hypothetical protein
MRHYFFTVPVLLLAASAAAGQAPVVPTPVSVPSPTQTLTGMDAGSTYSPSFNPDAGRGRLPCVWASADYIFGGVSHMETPELIQLVPAAAAALPVPPPGSAIRYFPSDTKLDFGTFNGYRVSAGVAFERWGADVSGFVFQRNTQDAIAASTGDPFSVAQQYTRAQTGEVISFLASLAGQYTGGVAVSADSRVRGGDANLRLPTYAFLTSYTYLLGGFRYVDVDENLGIVSQSTFTNGSQIQIEDHIHTRNQFYGGQVGIGGRMLGDGPGFGIDFVSKLALGSMHQKVDLSGSNTFLVPGQPADVAPGGVYASGSNLGSFERNKFAMVSESTVALTYNFTQNLQVSVGYTGLYLSSVVRPGNQIDQIVNDANYRFVANPPPSTFDRPTFEWRATDMWIHSLTLGAKVSY